MASSKLNQTNLTFTDSSSNTGILDFTTNEFNINKPVSVSNGITSTQVSVSGSGQITTLSSIGTLDMDTLNLNGSTSGQLTLQANSTTTNHTLTLPDSQGATGSKLENDGSGGLSWVVPNESHAGSSGNRRFHGYVDIGGTRMQYGSETCSTDSPQVVTLPASFSSTSYAISLSLDTSPGTGGSANIGIPMKITNKTVNSFTIDRDDDMSNTVYVDWVAIGQT